MLRGKPEMSLPRPDSGCCLVDDIGIIEDIAAALPSLEDFAELQESVRNVTAHSFNELRELIKAFPAEFRKDLFHPLSGTDFIQNPLLGELVCSFPDVSIEMAHGPPTQWVTALIGSEIERVRSLIPLSIVEHFEQATEVDFLGFGYERGPLASADVARLLLELPTRRLRDSEIAATLMWCGGSRRILRLLSDKTSEDISGFMATQSRSALFWFVESARKHSACEGGIGASVCFRRAAGALIFSEEVFSMDFSPLIATWPYLFRLFLKRFPDYVLAAVGELAAQAIDPFVVRILLSLGAEPSSWNVREGLMDASMDTMRLWNDNGILAAALERDCWYFTTLCGDRTVDIEKIRLLVRAGLKVNDVKSWGKTPLMYACEADRGDIVELLVAAGADVNWRSPAGTALHLAVSPGVVRTLLDAGADPSLPDSKGTSAAMRARVAGRSDLVSLMTSA